MGGEPGLRAGSSSFPPRSQLTEEAALDEASGFNIPVEPAPGSRAQPCKAETEVSKASHRLPSPHLPQAACFLPYCSISMFPFLSFPKPQSLLQGPQAEEEELPWCCICNEDATVRCAGCDGDLYCARCFRWVLGEYSERRMFLAPGLPRCLPFTPLLCREGHDNFDLKEHQTSPYHPRPPCQEH